MDSRSRFRPRLDSVEPSRDPGTKRERLCGWPCNGVGGQPPRPDAKETGQPVFESRRVDRQEKLDGELPDVRTANRHRWARRVASGARVRRGQGTRHNDPVTSEEGMPCWETGLPRYPDGAAVNRPKRLFSKNTGACQAA